MILGVSDACVPPHCPSWFRPMTHYIITTWQWGGVSGRYHSVQRGRAGTQPSTSSECVLNKTNGGQEPKSWDDLLLSECVTWKLLPAHSTSHPSHPPVQPSLPLYLIPPLTLSPFFPLRFFCRVTSLDRPRLRALNTNHVDNLGCLLRMCESSASIATGNVPTETGNSSAAILEKGNLAKWRDKYRNRYSGCADF